MLFVMWYVMYVLDFILFYSQLTRSHVLGHMMLMLAVIAPLRSLVMTREASSIERPSKPVWRLGFSPGVT